jgi:MoaA/NifB/PqqE/SkfB family radical SAM enzyme
MQKQVLKSSREDVEQNSLLNNKELEERKIILESYPKSLFIQLDAPCNQDCLFCSRPESYSHFELDKFKNSYLGKLETALCKAERINLTGSGELLFLPEAKEILEFFNSYKYSEKMFATNGSSLTPKMVDFIAGSENRYTIHVSLHASKKELHEQMTKSISYNAVKWNLEHLRKIARKNLTVNFIFLATKVNIHDLPDFIKFAKEYNASAVIVYYNFIYRPDQKDISCYFIQDKTNLILDAAKQEAEKLNIRLVLPPKFGNKETTSPMCTEAWSDLMINPRGDILTCDAAGDSNENLNGKEFMEVWNGKYYTDIRKKLSSGGYSCSRYCFRANPSAINDLRSHTITRGKTEAEINEMLKGS